jgi:hypothetical protein
VSLYFATQDNGIWASPDAGGTWTNHEGGDAFLIQVRHDAPMDADVTVAYGKVLDRGYSMFSEADLVHPRVIPDLDEDERPIDGLTQAFYVAPNRWIRWRVLAGDPEIWVSQNNGRTWHRRATVALGIAGGFQTAGADSSPTVYAPVVGRQRGANGQRIALLKLTDGFARREARFDDADLVYLPDGGSLGMRATEFDSHAVFGVDPSDANHLIVPDVNNNSIMVSSDGGLHWSRDDDLTAQVTQFGRLLLYDDHPLRMQVTQISFDPYVSGRILVGTRDSGVIYRDAAGPWTTIEDSERLSYVTGFFFKRDHTVIASTYGRGLWMIDLDVHHNPFPQHRYCRAPCWIRFWDDRNILREPPDWRDKDVTVFFDGRINGVVAPRGRVRAITVTIGTRWQRFLGKAEPTDYKPLTVVESKRGRGFGDLHGFRAAVEKGEVIKGLILQEGNLWGLLSGQREFRSRTSAARHKPTPQMTAVTQETWRRTRAATGPYIILSTGLPTPGLPVVGPDGLLRVIAHDLSTEQGAVIKIRIDGKPMRARRARVHKDGTMITSLMLPESWASAIHVLELEQKVGGRRRIASAQFATGGAEPESG